MTKLRKQFNHMPAKWSLLQQRYTDEHDANREAVARSVKRAESGSITLVYGTKDERHNQAVVLKGFIKTRVLGILVN